MDLAIEANRNSALFNTMQQVLDVYNPLLHKARPTVVNQTKHRIRVNPTRWGNTLDQWSGSRTVRFDLPRIGSLVDATLKVAFQIPGTFEGVDRGKTGDKGIAKKSLTTGGLNNTDTTANTARGRLDRLYADRLLGFNMIRSYTVSSKSRQIFRATGEYLLTRFSQMDIDMKEAVFRSVTPVDVMSTGTEDMFYAPAVTYQMAVPLFMFFNEHITSSLDVNFSEEVHIDIEVRAPSELFYYGNLGTLTYAQQLVGNDAGANGKFQVAQVGAGGGGSTTGVSGGITVWDQSTSSGSATVKPDGEVVPLDVRWGSRAPGTADSTNNRFWGTYNVSRNFADTDNLQKADAAPISNQFQSALVSRQQKHIQGLAAPWDIRAESVRASASSVYNPTDTLYEEAGVVASGTTFKYQDVDNNGESMSIQFELNADYIIQDTDAYRALRAQTFPEGTGFTSIVYDTAQETFTGLMARDNTSDNLLDTRSGGSFTDPDQSMSGITTGDSTRFVDLQLRVNNLCFSTSFMVRKTSDLGGTGDTTASNAVKYGRSIAKDAKTLGAHQIYTRALPIHYFQILAAGRVIYESDGKSHLNLSQSSMYNGTGREWGSMGSDLPNAASPTTHDSDRLNGRPFNIYTVNFGLQSSRLENTGCLSYQNLNNPTLRIFFKPDTWAEHQVEQHNDGSSEAKVAAALGVQVDVIHEFFNVVTVNSGNGEITSGLNQ